MILLNERDYFKAMEDREADRRSDTKAKPDIHEAYELRFPFGSQVLMVWEK